MAPPTWGEGSWEKQRWQENREGDLSEKKATSLAVRQLQPHPQGCHRIT